MSDANTIATGLAALAACISAWAAYSAHKTASAQDKIQTFRETRRLAQEVWAAANSIDEIAKKLRLERDTQAAFAGQFGGSRHRLLTEEIDEKLREIGWLDEAARSFLKETKEVGDKTVSQLAEAASGFEEELIHLRHLKDDFLLDYGAVSADNRDRRAEALDRDNA